MPGHLLRALLFLAGAAIAMPAAILVAGGVLEFDGGIDGGTGDGSTPGAFLAGLFVLGGLALAAAALWLLAADAGAPRVLADGSDRLAVRGPWRHCRNPMVSASLLLIAGAALWFDSWPLAVWLALFYLFAALYLSRVEEPALERRFGGAWHHYRVHVPRWFPSPLAYDPDIGREEP
jgi:protein-S-isoprenylcysteine O-methyltransferase Ste14